MNAFLFLICVERQLHAEGQSHEELHDRCYWLHTLIKQHEHTQDVYLVNGEFTTKPIQLSRYLPLNKYVVHLFMLN